AAADVQATHPRTDRSLRRPESTGGRGAAEAICTGLEGLLPAGANAKGLAKAGRVDASPVASDPTQALAPRHYDLPGIAGAGGRACDSPSGGGQQPPLVAQQRWRAKSRAEYRLLRPTGDASPCLTSTSRTARCGPACRVVWQ